MPIGRRHDDSERTTALYLSFALHFVLGLGLAIEHLTKTDPPDLALHQEVDVLSVTEFDPLWRGRKLTRELLDSADGASPSDSAATAPGPLAAGSPPDLVAAVAAAGPASQVPPTSQAAPPAPSPHRPGSTPDEITGSAALPPLTPRAENAPDRTAVLAIVALPESLERDRALLVRATGTLHSVSPADTAPRGPVHELPAQAFETPEPPMSGPLAGAPQIAPASEHEPAEASVPDAQTMAMEGSPPRALRPVAEATPVHDSDAAPKRAGEVVSPNRRHAPLATIEGVSPAKGYLAAAVEARRGDPEDLVGRSVPPLDVGSDAFAEDIRMPSPALELAFDQSGSQARRAPEAPEAVSGQESTSALAKFDLARLIDGLLPFPRPAPLQVSPAEAAVEAVKWNGAFPRVLPEVPFDANLGKISRILAGVECGRLSGDLDEATGSIRLEGYLASLAERARIYGALARLDGVTEIRDSGIVILPRPLCGVLDTLRNVGLTPSSAHQVSPKMLGRPTQPGIKRFRHGERIIIRLTTPRWPAYVYVDFYDLRGRVTHLIPNARAPANRFVPGHSVSVGEEGSGIELRASAPYGANILVAIGTSKPLFDKARLPVEPSGSYLVALTQVIENLRGQSYDFAEEYIYVFVITQDISPRAQRTQDKRRKGLVSKPR